MHQLPGNEIVVQRLLVLLFCEFLYQGAVVVALGRGGVTKWDTETTIYLLFTPCYICSPFLTNHPNP